MDHMNSALKEFVKFIENQNSINKYTKEGLEDMSNQIEKLRITLQTFIAIACGVTVALLVAIGTLL